MNSDTVPAGDVNDQSPAAGEMAALGTQVDYTISIGPETVAVPDLSGAAADAADEAQIPLLAFISIVEGAAFLSSRALPRLPRLPPRW